MGRIGAEVAKRAKAFEMSVIVYDPFLTESRAKVMGVEQVEKEEMFARSDYITVHMPLTDQTKYMIDEAAISMMKDGVRLFNCARGGIIKESALLEALDSGKVAAAGLDVYEEEPPKKIILSVIMRISIDAPPRRFNSGGPRERGVGNCSSCG